jgi:hypothetical protein
VKNGVAEGENSPPSLGTTEYSTSSWRFSLRFNHEVQTMGICECEEEETSALKIRRFLSQLFPAKLF